MRRRTRTKYKYSTLVGECGERIPIPRVHHQREKGHIKDLWCPRCKEVHHFTEYRWMEPMATIDGVSLIKEDQN